MLTRQTHNNKCNANVATPAESVIAAAEQSIKLCNEAVSLFDENCSTNPKHFQTAIIKLSKALMVVKQHNASRQKQAKLEQQRLEVSMMTATVFDIDALFPLPQPSTQNQMDGDDDEGSSNNSTDDSEGEGTSFVYNHLIRLPPPLHQVLQAYEGYASSVLTIIQIVITFNLALIYHLLGLTSSSSTTSSRRPRVRNGGNNGRGNSSSSPVLRVAIGLYEDALTLFQQQQSSPSSSNNNIISTTAIFRLATLNNLSNICNLVGDETSEGHYLSQLLSTTALMTTSIKNNNPNNNKQKVVDPQRYYEHFFETSMSLVCPVYGAGTA